MEPQIDLARRAHAMLERAMELEPRERRAFVDKHCAGDGPLIDRLRALLNAADEADHFLDVPALENPGRASVIPDAVGDYLVVGVLGSGGMATVYEAIQSHPRRNVALKVMHKSVTDAEAYLRFQFETEALARLQHPGIAQIYEAGAAQLGRPSPSPFFAMELVPDAAPITTFADKHELPLRDRLVMLASVCDAVHHGHQHGVIHRDLKPANVLVDGEGRAKVIDFGVARVADAGSESPTALVGVPQLIGTLNYMSPEQCGARADIDIRSDVYSLGVMLYELACGRLPHDLRDKPLPAALHAIVNEAARPPELRGWPRCRDLEAIIVKATAKDPDRRYDSASALASDLRHYLSHRAIEARPQGIIDQFRLFSRRNRALVASASAVLTSIVVLAVVSTWFAVRLAEESGRRRDAEKVANEERDVARWQAYTAHIAAALAAMNSGEFQQMRTRLAGASDRAEGWELKFLSRMADRSASTIVAHDDMIMSMATSADWTRFVTAAGNGVVRLWDSGNGAMLASHTVEAGARVYSVAFTPDEQRIVCGDHDGGVRLLDARTLQEVELVDRAPVEVRSVAALHGGRIAAAGVDGSLRMWALDPRQVLEVPTDQAGGVHRLHVSPDRTLLATTNDQGAVWIRRASDMSVLQRLEFPGVVSEVRFSGDGRFVAAAGAPGQLLIWNLADGTLAQQIKATQGVNTVRSIAFSNDGTLLAAGLVHRGILVVSTADGSVVGELGGHTEAVSGLSFRPDDQLLASASWDRTIRTWRASEIVCPTATGSLTGHGDHVMSVAFSPDGAVLASASRDGTLRLWDPDLAEVVASVSTNSRALSTLAFSRDGRTIVTAGAGPLVSVIDAHTGVVRLELEGGPGGAADVAIDSGGQRLAAGGQDGVVRVWDLESPHGHLELRGHTARVNSVAFDPSGRLVASGSRDRGVRLWDAQTGEELTRLAGHESDVFAVLFSPDGRRLYSGSRDQTVRVWDVETGTCVATMQGHGQYVTSLALSPDGTRLAAGSWFGKVALFDVPTLDLIASFRAHDSAIRGVAFSPDGRWLATASYDSTVRLFDSATSEAAAIARVKAAADRAAARELVTPVLSQVGADHGAATGLLIEAGLDPGMNPWVRKAALSILAPAKEGP